MKRELFNNVKVIPGGTAAAIDRSGFLSAVLAASVTSATEGQTLAITITHCDTQDGDFVEVEDSHIGIDGALRETAVKTDELIIWISISWAANSLLKSPLQQRQR